MRPLGVIQHQDSLHLSTTNISPDIACPPNWDVQKTQTKTQWKIKQFGTSKAKSPINNHKAAP